MTTALTLSRGECTIRREMTPTMTSANTSPFTRLRTRILRIPLIFKLLVANSGIVAIGAVAGTAVTVWHVARYPNDPHLELIVVFLAAGLVLSIAVNSWVLHLALRPLDRLQQGVDDVRSGKTDVSVDPGPMADERLTRLVDTFNQMIAQSEENTRRLQQLPHQILNAQEEERQRLARELHDEAAQALTSLLVRLRLLERAQTPEEAQHRVQELRQLTAQALEEVRRVALDLRPTILDDLGLAPALEWRTDEINQDGALTATFSASGIRDRLPREIELTFYRVGQEALSNVIRHANARRVSTTLTQGDDALQLEIRDDGVGFHTEERFAANGHGLGLVGMHERLAMVGGKLSIDSTPGRGTTVIAMAPLPPVPTHRPAPTPADANA